MVGEVSIFSSRSLWSTVGGAGGRQQGGVFVGSWKSHYSSTFSLLPFLVVWPSQRQWLGLRFGGTLKDTENSCGKYDDSLGSRKGYKPFGGFLRSQPTHHRVILDPGRTAWWSAYAC